jgi:hypothetical protein
VRCKPQTRGEAAGVANFALNEYREKFAQTGSTKGEEMIETRILLRKVFEMNGL